MALWFTRGEKAVVTRSLFVLYTMAAAGALLDIDTPTITDFMRGKHRTLTLLFAYTGQFFHNYFAYHEAHISLHGVYRQFTAGFFGLVFFRWNYTPANRSRRGEVVDGVLLGVAIAIMCYSKLSYFLFGGLLFPVGYLLFPRNRLLHHTAVATFVILSVVFELAYGHVVSGYMLDILMMIDTNAREWVLHRFYGFITSPLLAILLAIIYGYYRSTRDLPTESYAGKLIWLSLCWVPLYFLINQYDAGDCGRINFLAPVMLLAFLVLEHRFLRYDQALPGVPRPARYWALLCMALIALTVASRTVTQVEALASPKSERDYTLLVDPLKEVPADVSSPPILNAAAFRPVYVECRKQGIDYDPCRDRFVQEHGGLLPQRQLFIDGMDMIMRNHADHLMVFDFVDPYSIMLDLSPARHLSTWFAAETFSDFCFPAAEALFSYVDYVLVPHYPILDWNQWQLFDDYGEDLERLYAVVDSSDEFTLYKRKKPAIFHSRRYDCAMHGSRWPVAGWGSLD